MEVRTFQDETYHVCAEPHEHYVEFTIYESHNGWDADQDPLFTGSIKWDGCSNWDFGSKDTTHPLHFCEPGDVRRFGEFLIELYQWAAELLPDHKEDILYEPK